MKNIIRLTNDFIIQQRIRALPLRLHDLECLCGSVGYELYPYDIASGIIVKLNLKQYTRFPAFMVTTNQYKIIFYDNSADTGTRLFSIAHELGHIVLKHGYRGVLGNSQTDTAQEHEADVFAYQLLAPLCVLKARHITDLAEIEEETLLNPDQARYIKNKLDVYDHQPGEAAILKLYHIHKHQVLGYVGRVVNAIIYLCAVIATVAVVYAATTGNDIADGLQPVDNMHTTSDALASLQARMTDKQPAQTTTAPQTDTPGAVTDTSSTITKTASPEQGDTVYVTRSGGKYHRPGCRYIKNKDTIALTISDAQASGKTPCSVCFK